MPIAGAIVFEIKMAVDIVLAEDGLFYVDSSTMKGDAVHSWAIRYGTQGAREPAVAVRRAGDREAISVQAGPMPIRKKPHWQQLMPLMDETAPKDILDGS